MKIFRYILLASLTCTLFSCGPDELIPESVPPVVNPGDKDEPGEEPEEPEEPEKEEDGMEEDESQEDDGQMKLF